MRAAVPPGTTRTVALVAARDEEGRIGPCVEALSEIVTEVVVVDDASTDGTPAEASESGATVLRVGRRLGKGAALEGALRRVGPAAVWLLADGDLGATAKGLSVLVGLMVSLGGASVIGQAFSGMILMYARVFRNGDYVRIGDNEGTVIELGMFATRLRTGMGEEITLSNSNVMAATTKNYSRAVPGTGYVVDTVVTIGYGTPWRQVEAMLLEAARRTQDIAQKPPPMVRQTALSDYYVEYRLVAYTPLEQPAPRVEVLHRLHGNIQDVFNEFGVQIMSPHYELDPKSPQVVPKDQWYAAPARAPKEP